MFAQCRVEGCVGFCSDLEPMEEGLRDYYLTFRIKKWIYLHSCLTTWLQQRNRVPETLASSVLNSPGAVLNQPHRHTYVLTSVRFQLVSITVNWRVQQININVPAVKLTSLEMHKLLNNHHCWWNSIWWNSGTNVHRWSLVLFGSIAGNIFWIMQGHNSTDYTTKIESFFVIWMQKFYI